MKVSPTFRLDCIQNVFTEHADVPVRRRTCRSLSVVSLKSYEIPSRVENRLILQQPLHRPVMLHFVAMETQLTRPHATRINGSKKISNGLMKQSAGDFVPQRLAFNCLLCKIKSSLIAQSCVKAKEFDFLRTQLLIKKKKYM